MKRLLFALALAALCGPAQAQGTIVGPGQQVLCPNMATLAVGTTGLTQIVALTSGQSVFVCGWHITNTAATGTFALSYGTGSNCGSGTTSVIPAMNVSNTAPSTDHIEFAFYNTPTGQALCINPSVATIAAIVYYNKF